MKTRKTITVLSSCLLQLATLIVTLPSGNLFLTTTASEIPNEVSQWLNEVQKYRLGASQAAWTALERWVAQHPGEQAVKQLIAKQLVSIIKQPIALEAKYRAARLFSQIGTPDLAEALVDLLSDEADCEVAAYALRTIASEAIDTKILSQLSKAQTVKTRQTIITLIGDRQIAQAAPLLACFVEQSPELQKHALYALGKLGTQNALQLLHSLWRQNQAQPNQYEEPLMECLVRLSASCQLNQTTLNIAHELFSKSANPLIQIAVLDLISRQPNGINLLAEAATHPSSQVRCAAARKLATALGVTSGRQMEELEAQVNNMEADALEAFFDQALIEKKSLFLPLARKLVEQAASKAPSSAINYLAELGKAEDIDVLLRLLTSKQNALSELIVRALASTTNPAVDNCIAGIFTNLTTPPSPELYELVRLRKVEAVEPFLISALKDLGNLPNDADQIVNCLGIIGTPQSSEALLTIAANVPNLSEQAWKSLRFILQRHGASEPIQRLLVSTYIKQTNAQLRSDILELLPAAPCDQFLGLLCSALWDSADEVRLAAVRALSQWTNLQAADYLIAIIETSANEAERTVAQAGLARLLGSKGLGKEMDYVRLWNRALAIAGNRQFRLQLLSAFMSHPLPQLIEPLSSYLNDSTLLNEAKAAFIVALPALAHGLPDSQQFATSRLQGLSTGELRAVALQLANRLKLQGKDLTDD